MLVDKERYLATARLWTEKYASGTIENANEGDEVSGKDVPVQVILCLNCKKASS